MNRKIILSVCIALMVSALVSIGSAEVPEIISYQGILSDANRVPLTGNYDLTVRIYDQQTAGTALWNETHTGVPVSGGLFNIQLGSVTPFSASVDFSTQYWLGISINGGTELAPRSQFTSVSTALMAKRVIQGGVPAGMVAAFAMATPPSGWLECNGQAVSRTVYYSLFAAIGTMYGPGDGGTTFSLPDYRGLFLRSVNSGRNDEWKDEDAGSRMDRGDGTSGDVVGSKQGGEIKRHNHLLQMGAKTFPWAAPNFAYSYQYQSTATIAHGTGQAGGSETRPKNISVYYCIKY